MVWVWQMFRTPIPTGNHVCAGQRPYSTMWVGTPGDRFLLSPRNGRGAAQEEQVMGRTSTRFVAASAMEAISVCLDVTRPERLTEWNRSGNERAHATSRM